MSTTVPLAAVPLSYTRDPNDDRLAIEWVDKYGQVVHPGDLVTWNNWRGVEIARLVAIRLLAKNHKPFSHGRPQAVLQMVDPVTLESKDRTLQQYDRERSTPSNPVYIPITSPYTWNVRNPQDECIRVEIKR